MTYLIIVNSYAEKVDLDNDIEAQEYAEEKGRENATFKEFK